MIQDSAMLEVRNLTNHQVVYNLEDERIRRVFHEYETKKISAGELRKVYYNDGGYLFRHYLCIVNKEFAAEFGMTNDTPEYWWTLQDIDYALNEGSLDMLYDALEFGPDGIVDALTDRAIELKLNDMSKRHAIEEMTGINITGMIALKEQYEQMTNSGGSQGERRRRVQTNTETTTSGRRVKTEA